MPKHTGAACSVPFVKSVVIRHVGNKPENVEYGHNYICDRKIYFPEGNGFEVPCRYFSTRPPRYEKQND